MPLKDRGPVTAPFQNYRQELVAADSPNIPSISRDPPSAPLAHAVPWANESSTMPSTALLPPARGFFDDGPEPMYSHRPGTARTDTSESFDVPWNGDNRRPSVASSTTVGSQNSVERAGSKSRAQKIASKFGSEDVRMPGERTQSVSARSAKVRNNSVHLRGEDGIPGSPSLSRPRTPQTQASSDVAPWAFQDYQVSLRCSAFSMIIFGYTSWNQRSSSTSSITTFDITLSVFNVLGLGVRRFSKMGLTRQLALACLFFS